MRILQTRFVILHLLFDPTYYNNFSAAFLFVFKFIWIFR